MELTIIITSIVGTALSIVGILGFSHSKLRSRMDKLEMKINTKPSEDEVRLVINDKLESHRVQYAALSKRIDEIYRQHEKINIKMDQLLRLCARIGNDRQ